MTTETILDYWPFPYPMRGNQITALTWLQNQSAKYILMEVPVGGGKSNIGITYSHFLGQRLTTHRGDSLILTPQRILQEQYELSFSGNKEIAIASLYGKSNYTCASKNTTCEIGSLVKPSCSKCPFAEAKRQATLAADTVLNYKLALTSFAYTTTFKPRKLMVLDECHTLENQLIDFDALQITEWRCKKYNLQFKTFNQIAQALEWMGEYYIPEMRKALCKLEDECEPLFEKSGDELTRSELRKIRELSGLQEHFDGAMTMSVRTPDYVDEKFVLVWDKVMFQFKRLTGAYSFHKHIVPFADRFLFMSSTILNREGFCADLGINENDAAFLSLESEFPKENRQVFYMPQMKMNAKWKEPENKDDQQKMLESVSSLLELHKNDSGIIHTANFQIADWLVNNLPNVSHRVYHHNPDSGDDRNAVINAFIGDPAPSVLISPSITEGLDLKESLGRFSIFVKVPFGYLGDQWIKRRMEMSLQWYHRRALTDVIQGGGRIVRSTNDWGNVYILDASWAYLYKQAYYMIPRWWREAYSVV